MSDEIERMKADLIRAEQSLRESGALDTLEQASGFLRLAVNIPLDDPHFDIRVSALSETYPMASRHPAVKDWMKYHQGT